MKIEERLKELGITLLGLPKPLGSYVSCVQTGNLLFMSGVLPLRDGKLVRTGRVGEDISLDDANKDARQIVINAISALKAHLGDLDKICRCVKVNGFVASGADFYDQPKVLNGASDLLVEIFGEKGKHARSAVGVYALPLNAPVEVDFIFEVIL
jgi:enamine deaminase RidA (YjgF/YER057c/UK114 family)